MKTIRTHYDNLQVSENASAEVIKGAYRYLAQKWHPDKNPDNRAEAERITKIINEAYEILSDPERRKEHDRWIAEQRAATEMGDDAASREQSTRHGNEDASSNTETGREQVDGHRRALREKYAEAVAKGGRFGAFFSGFLASFIVLSIAVGMNTWVEQFLDRHPWLAFVPFLVGFASASSHVREKRAKLLAEHDDKMLEVLYGERMRNKTVWQTVIGVAVVIVAVGFAALYFAGSEDRRAPSIVDASAAPTPANSPAQPDVALAPASSPIKTVPELYFFNQCKYPIRLALVYLDMAGQWQTSGWWEFDGKAHAYLKTADGRIRSNNSIAYLYAEVPNTTYKWVGSEGNTEDMTQQLGDAEYRFRKMSLKKDGDGDFVLSTVCPDLQ